MTRSDDDTWDLASSVGVTATMVATVRALATRDSRRLIDDPFAEPFVSAVGIDFFVKLIDGKVDASAFGEVSPERVQAMIAAIALRTRFFDDYLIGATAGGIRQAVILAAGLDSRAYRLSWPAGTVVYEVDQPAVIDFKGRVLTDLAATPAASRRTVGVDLRDDWPAALRAAGFDPAAPTAWLAEGLLIYLPPEAQDRLFDTITRSSAPGSAVATEYVPGIVGFDPEKAREMSARVREQGVDLDMPSLVYRGPRNNVIEYLRGLGWRVSAVPGDRLFVTAGLPPPQRDDSDSLGEITYVSAELGRSPSRHTLSG